MAKIWEGENWRQVADEPGHWRYYHNDEEVTEAEFLAAEAAWRAAQPKQWDYRALLGRYMKHIVELEGVDFLGYAGETTWAEGEREELQRISNEYTQPPEPWPV